jgi:Skp family chaperone for outer membrane proteins
MKQMIRDQETEDIQKREQQRAAQRRYQQELDSQLNELRQRSIDSLQSNKNDFAFLLQSFYYSCFSF